MVFTVGSHPFPAGTVVSVYVDRGQIPDGAPQGTVVTTGTVAASSALSFSGLEELTGYYAVALVAGVWRWVGFHTEAAGTQIGSVQDEGVDLPLRGALNFIGDGVAVVDNPGSDRTDVTVEGGGGGGSTAGQANVVDFGAEPGRKVTDAAITSGSALLSSTAAAFTPDDVGKVVLIQRAGAPIATPTGFAGTPVGSAGLFGAGTVYYRIAAGVAETSIPAAEISVAVSLNDAVDLSWTAVPGLAELGGYYIVWRTTVSGNYSGSKLVGVVRAVDSAGAAVTTMRDEGRTLFPSGFTTTTDLSHADLEAEIVSVSGGVATLDVNAANTRTGAIAYIGKNFKTAWQAALASPAGEVIIPNPAAPPGSFDAGFYLQRGAVDMSQYSNKVTRGLGNPRIDNMSRDEPALDMLSTIRCGAKNITIASVNRWAAKDAGIVCDYSTYPVFAHLAAPITSTATHLTTVEAFEEFGSPNGEIGVFVTWDYDPMASPQVGPGGEGMFVKVDLVADPTGHTWAITAHNRFGSTAQPHLAGANIAARDGQWDCNEIDIDFTFESEVYQPSLGSGCRLNRIISSRVKMSAGGTGGGWPACGPHPVFKGGQYTGYLVIGNNTRRMRYGQANAYANVVTIDHPQFRRGGNCFILVESTDCETLVVEQPTFEQLTFTHSGAMLGGPGCQLYAPEIRNPWCGDVGGSGGSWFWHLVANRPGKFSVPNMFTPSGGDNNSGFPFYLIGGWSMEGGFVTAGDPTYAGFFYYPGGDNFGLTLLGGTQFIGSAPFSAPSGMGPHLLSIAGGAPVPGIYEQPFGPVQMKGRPVKTITAHYSFLIYDYGVVFVVDSASAVTISIGDYSAYSEGAFFSVLQAGAGQVTVSGSNVTGFGGTKTAGVGAWLDVARYGLNAWNVTGDATT